MSDLAKDHPQDGRKYHIGDEVEFTDDDGKKVPGVVHGVSYQEGQYELVNTMRPDMHSPEGPDNMPIPGTGELVLVPGTDGKRHSFQYIMVHKHEHEAWWKVEGENRKKVLAHEKALKEHHEALKTDPKHKAPETPAIAELPPLKQHVRVYEED